MNGNFFKRLPALLAFSAACLALAPGGASAVGPVTSRFPTAKFALMKGWWGSDHDGSTPGNFRYMQSLAIAQGASIDTFNIATSISALSQANLDKYDVVIWYNVYRMYEHFDSAVGNRIQRWYENGNKGLACYHQCVRHSGWTWWGNMMGREYLDFAGNGSGPVYIDAEAVASIYPAGPYTAGQSVTVNDEWYVYETVGVRGTPGTKMLWTTKRSAFPTSNWRMPDGEDKPVAWVRDYRGGRFSMNGMFHNTALATTTSSTLRPLYDSTLIGTMRYLAGYDGCKDSTYVEYNPKATHQKAGACVTPSFINVGKTGNGAERVKLDDFKISFSQPGSHSVEIFSTRGTRVASHRGEGTREYRFSEIRQPGVYYVRILTSGMKAPLNRRVVLL